jgi:hypothetical protein
MVSLSAKLALAWCNKLSHKWHKVFIMISANVRFNDIVLKWLCDKKIYTVYFLENVNFSFILVY